MSDLRLWHRIHGTTTSNLLHLLVVRTTLAVVCISKSSCLLEIVIARRIKFTIFVFWPQEREDDHVDEDTGHKDAAFDQLADDSQYNKCSVTLT